MMCSLDLRLWLIEKELTSPALKSLRDAVASMTPCPTLAARFYNPVNLLLFKQEYNKIRVMHTNDPQLGNWVTNMKTQLRNLMQRTGHFSTEFCYIQYLTKNDFTFRNDSAY